MTRQEKNVVVTPAISAAAAQTLVADTIEKAGEIGIAVSVAVIDPSGLLKAFVRMDGSTLRSSEVAQTKAYSAVSFGLATDRWYNLAKDDGELLYNLPQLDRFTMLGGGHPIYLDGVLIGSIGVSGGPTAEADSQCALSALERSGFQQSA